jgi:hypothetical protein
MNSSLCSLAVPTLIQDTCIVKRKHKTPVVDRELLVATCFSCIADTACPELYTKVRMYVSSQMICPALLCVGLIQSIQVHRSNIADTWTNTFRKLGTSQSSDSMLAISHIQWRTCGESKGYSNCTAQKAELEHCMTAITQNMLKCSLQDDWY